MARIPKPPKQRRGKQPRCWTCKKIATVSVDETHYTHWGVARFFPEFGEFRMVVVCSEECADQVQAESTDAARDLRRKVMRESPVAMTLTMLDMLKEK